MGKLRRQKTKKPKLHELAASLVQEKLADDGKLIEGGWGATHAMMFASAPPEIKSMLRLAYIAGAEHVFMSTLGVMSDSEEITQKDMDRMDKVYHEVMAIREELKFALELAQGKAQ